MLDIIKEGIRLNQSLALLPLRAARSLISDKNTSAKQMVDIAEDFVSIPFVAAARAIENTCQTCSKEADRDRSCSSRGPGIRNIWINPAVTVFSDVELIPGKRRAILTVTGLLCGG